MQKILLLLIGFIITGCGVDSINSGNDVVTPSDYLVANCVTNTGDASITGNVILVHPVPSLTDNSFTIVSITDHYSATTIGQSCVAGIQNSPFAYQIFYNTQDIYANNLYLIDVNIYEKFDGGNYYSRDISLRYPIITNGNGTTVDIYAYSVAVSAP